MAPNGSPLICFRCAGVPACWDGLPLGWAVSLDFSSAFPIKSAFSLSSFFWGRAARVPSRLAVLCWLCAGLHSALMPCPVNRGLPGSRAHQIGPHPCCCASVWVPPLSSQTSIDRDVACSKSRAPGCDAGPGPPSARLFVFPRSLLFGVCSILTLLLRPFAGEHLQLHYSQRNHFMQPRRWGWHCRYQVILCTLFAARFVAATYRQTCRVCVGAAVDCFVRLKGVAPGAPSRPSCFFWFRCLFARRWAIIVPACHHLSHVLTTW